MSFLILRQFLVSFCIIAIYLLVLFDNACCLRTFDLEEAQRKLENGGERYRYRNSDGTPVHGRQRDHDQIEDDNSNPLFPPKSDAFWEVDRKQRGRNAEQPKRTSGGKESQGGGRRSDGTKGARPNIILILTDDQDIELGSMEYMPETLKVFRENGVEFRHGYVTTPMCCPSRSSMLTGLYVHNHQVYTNNDNCSSIFWREKFEFKTFAAYLQGSGYFTSYIGKYLNKYDGSHIPMGWDDWNALLMNSRFYNYTVNRNGVNIRYGNNYQRDYYPDSIANDTVNFLERMADPTTDDPDAIFPHAVLPHIRAVESEDDEEGSGSSAIPSPPPPKSRKPNQPFLLVVSFPSPHGPEDSAPQYSQLFLNETAHHTPAYNFAPNYDKQWILQVTPKMNSNLKDFTNLLMAKRLQTLQSVDASVKRIMETLKKLGLEDDTYVFYSSDHGYHIGQFGLIKGKSMPYEFDIRVPFFVKTPKNTTPGGTMILEPVLNIDLAPTFLDIAGLPVPPDMDGRSFLPLLQKYSRTQSTFTATNSPWTQTFLIESSGRRDSGHSAHPRTTPAPTTTKPPQVSEEEKAQVNELCDLHPHPCFKGQRKYCRRENDRVRFRKCRKDSDYAVAEPTGHCRCSGSKLRSKRQVLESNSTYFDWELERQRIDEEIEILKKRIDELRDKKRLLRQQQWMTSPKPHVPKVTEMSSLALENESSGKDHTKKKDEIQISILRPPGFARPETTPLYTEEMDTDVDLEDLEEGGGTDDLEMDEDLFVSPMTFTHSEEEPDPDVTDDKVDEMISKAASFVNVTTKHRKGSHRKGSHQYRGHGSAAMVNSSDSNSALDENPDCDCSKLDPRALRQQERMERKRKKLMSKLRKKQRFLNRIQDPTEREQAATCGEEDKMNCFWHDKQHWRTAPLWDGDSFCFCMNSHNNTFSCLRSINSTHNYLYCQFITGFKMYFDLGRDPYQLRNAVGNLPRPEEEWMIATLLRLKKCHGQVECHQADIETATESHRSFVTMTETIASVNIGEDEILEPSIWEKVFGTRFRRRKIRNGRPKKQHSTDQFTE